MSAIMDVVKPNLSHFVKDGSFDAERAFADYLCSLHLFIYPAIEMLKGTQEPCDPCGSALDFLEALDAGLTAMEKEIIKHRKAKKAA